MKLSQSELPKCADFAAWLQQRQSQLQVTKTTKTPSGQTIDWIPVESQSPEGIATPLPRRRRPRWQLRMRKGPPKGLLST